MSDSTCNVCGGALSVLPDAFPTRPDDPLRYGIVVSYGGVDIARVCLVCALKLELTLKAAKA